MRNSEISKCRGGRAVLIAEDNEDERVLVQSIFKQLGVRDDIYVVSDGGEALAFLKGEGKYSDRERFRFPSFLLTDINMPRMDGLELLMYLKRSNLIVVPTIVFTSSDDPDDIRQAYMLGANAYHVKSPDMESQREQVRMLHQYWCNVEQPAVDRFGKLSPSQTEKGRESGRHPVK